jgi:hypothetical protein
MFRMRLEKQIEKFYAKWSPALLAFCCLLLGEGSEADDGGSVPRLSQPGIGPGRVRITGISLPFRDRCRKASDPFGRGTSRSGGYN